METAMNGATQKGGKPHGGSEEEGETETPRAGQLIGERYLLEQPLERGAMGSVWRAEHVRLKAPVAVKFLESALIADTEMRDRFTQEARSAAAVRSANVVQVFDYGTEGGVPYIAMELLEGENLDTRLGRRGRLEPHELLKIFEEVARALGKAHAMGVVHRDLKPGNIFLAREGAHEITKLVDFGIAKVKADALNLSQIVGTQLGTMLGTPQYMSPEQMRGAANVDYRTDLWALAIIACECLTGRYPFSGTTIGDLTVQICTERPLAPSSLGHVPPGFDQWFFKATRKTPQKRFESAEQMAKALSKLFASAESAIPLVSGAPKLPRLPQRTVLRQAGAAVIARLDAGLRAVQGTALRLADRATMALSSLGWRLKALSERWPIRASLPQLSRPALFASVGVVVLCTVLLFRLSSSPADEQVSAQPEQLEQPEQPEQVDAKPATTPETRTPKTEQVVLAALPAPPAREPTEPPAVAPLRTVEAPPQTDTEPQSTDNAQGTAVASSRQAETRQKPRARPAQNKAKPESADPIAEAAARLLQASEKSPAPDKGTSRAAGSEPRAAARHPFDDRL